MAAGARIPARGRLRKGPVGAGRVAARMQAMDDLYFLARDVLGYKDLVEGVHRPICGFFHRKQFRSPVCAQDGPRQRLLLYPRGAFKTTLDLADAIQWILNFPDIRILLMSGTRELAVRMVHEMKSHFTSNRRMRDLFPEFCAPEGKDLGTQDEFTSPARKLARLREPTVSVSTTESVKAGSHYELIKLDDVVTEQNSSTPEQLEKTWRAFNYTEPLLEPGGFRDVIGTRYHQDDCYGRILATQLDEWCVLTAPAWRLKDGRPENSVVPEDYDLLFPERLSFKTLARVRRSDGWLFAAQYLNDPRERSRARLTREKLLRQVVPAGRIPTSGPTFQAWDLAYSDKPGRDFSAGVCGRFDAEGRLWVMDAVRERLSPSALVGEIVALAKRHAPQRVGIEASLGAQFLDLPLRQAAMAAGAALPLDWIKIARHGSSKLGRIMALEPWIEGGRIFFSAALPNLEHLLEELECAGSARYDDMADALAHLTRYHMTPETKWWNVQRKDDPDPEIVSARLSPRYDELCGYGIPG